MPSTRNPSTFCRIGFFNRQTAMADEAKAKSNAAFSSGDFTAAVNHFSEAFDTHDQLVQTVMELKLQNEFLKYQFEGFWNLQPPEPEGGESEVVKQLRQTIESLNVELLEEKQTRAAAEVALKHLQESHFEADSRAQELSVKLAEARQKLDQEIKEQEEKYSDLDSKFTRLHKRAKQRRRKSEIERRDGISSLRPQGDGQAQERV